MYKKKEATDTAEISNPNRKRTDMETNEKIQKDKQTIEHATTQKTKERAI